MRKKLEPLGTVFNRWTVLEYLGLNKHQMRMVRARCVCGNESEVIMANLRAGVSKGCNSCGYIKRGRTGADWEKDRYKKLDYDSVLEIKRRLAHGESMAQLARDYMMGRNAMRDIKYGHSWVEVPFPENFIIPWRAKAI